MNIVRYSHNVSHIIVIRAFLSDKTGGKVIFRIIKGKNTTDNPNKVGIDQYRNSPPPFMASTKKKISNKAAILHRIHYKILFCEDIKGITVSAATSIMDAVTTRNTPSPPPFAIDTIKVIMIGRRRIPAITTPALNAAFRSF